MIKPAGGQQKSACGDPPALVSPAWLRLALLFLLVIFAGLFLFNSLSRIRRLSADSLNYIDVGRNLTRGEGLVQSTLVIARPLQVWEEARTIAPFVSQPPFYPLAIAALSRLGVPFTDAALLISGLAFLAALGFSFLIARELYDEVTAWLSVAVLALTPHLASLGNMAWSETLGIAWLLAGLWLLARLGGLGRFTRRATLAASWRSTAAGQPRWDLPAGMLWLALAAGLCAGLAFATRYALGALILAGLSYIWIATLPGTSRQARETRAVDVKKDAPPPSQQSKPWFASLKPGSSFWPLGGLYLAGWSLPAGLVLAHNWLNIGRLFPINLPADKALLANLGDALLVLFGGYLANRIPAIHQLILVGFALGALILAAVIKGDPLSYFHARLCKSGRFLLWLWSLIYLVFLVMQRSVSFFDELDLRLLAPAAVPLILVCAALFSGLFERRSQGIVSILAAMLLCLALVGQLRLLRLPPAPSLAQEIAASPRLSWLADHTTSYDLVIGDTTNDVPYYFDRHAAVSFSPYPYTILLTPSTLQELAVQYCEHYDSLYLVLRRRKINPVKLRQQFGRYVANLWEADLAKYPELELIADLPDSRIFRLKLCSD